MLDRGTWTYSRQRVENLDELRNLKLTYVFTFVGLWIPSPSRDMTSTQEPNPVVLRGVGWCLNNKPVLSREERIIDIYSPLQSACGEKFISTVDIAVIAFSPTAATNILNAIIRFL
ncbi:hypothetical protein TNCV_471441 [Trichonephila clavipes]|nr:hypothetical protein TNCV_471441 [Trichonephila clavipes]